MPIALISLGVLLTLTSSVIAPLPEGYRYPTSTDRAGWWGTSEENGSVPFRAEGDFDGDGRQDRAWILLRESGVGASVFVFLNPRHGEPVVIELSGITGETSAQNYGLRVVEPGQYETACGKGYWKCKPGEPESLHLMLPALDFYAFEGANSYFWWDSKSMTFVRTWMSD